MKRSKYLKKKFGYYEAMHQISKEAQDMRRAEHVLYMERLKLEVVLQESRVRSKLMNEIVGHFTNDKIKHDLIEEIKEQILKGVKEKL